MIRAMHHVGIVVKRLEAAYRFYRDALGLPLLQEATIADQGVRAALLAAGESEIELLEPIDAGTGMARFLARRGEGLHHLCLETADVAAALATLGARGAELLDATPRPGLAGQIAFLHPRACAGVLVELATPPPSAHRPPAPLRLRRLVIGACDPRQTAERFQQLFELTEVAMNGGPRAMLAVGRGALLFVPVEDVGASEGLVALSLIAEDFPHLRARLEAAGTPGLWGTGELTVEAAATHGVPLHVSRDE